MSAAAHALNFEDIKAKVGMERVVSYLNLEGLRRVNDTQLKGICPFCKSPKGFVISFKTDQQPSGAFICFGSCKNKGDLLELVSLVRGHPPRDRNGSFQAAKELQDHFLTGKPDNGSTVTTTVRTVTQKTEAGANRPTFDAQAYAKRLDPAHEAIQVLDLAPETYRAFCAGYATTGKLRGRLALPLADRQGKVLCYVGRALNGEQPQLLYGLDGFDPKSVLFGWEKVEHADLLYVARDPIEVLRAYEAGVTNVVAFLGDITSDTLQTLSLLMDELSIPTVELL